MTDSTLEDSMTAPIVGTLRDNKIIWKTDELRAKYETPNKPMVQSAQPARAFVTRPQGRFEVIVRDTFTHEGVLMARVVPVDDVNMYGVDLTYEIPASLIETEAGCLES